VQAARRPTDEVRVLRAGDMEQNRYDQVFIGLAFFVVCGNEQRASIPHGKYASLHEFTPSCSTKKAEKEQVQGNDVEGRESVYVCSFNSAMIASGNDQVKGVEQAQLICVVTP
jgi:hypothetical protein